MSLAIKLIALLARFRSSGYLCSVQHSRPADFSKLAAVSPSRATIRYCAANSDSRCMENVLFDRFIRLYLHEPLILEPALSSFYLLHV